MQSLPKLPVLEFSDDAQETIRKSYNLHEPGRMDEAIDILSEWAKKQDHFMKKEFPRDYLERIIISAKGSLEKSKVRLDKLCTLKTLVPKFFEDQDLNEVKHVLAGFTAIVLPKYAPNHYRLYLIKGYAKQIAPSDFLPMYKYSMRMCEYWTKYDYFSGIVLVFDFTHKDFNITEFMINNNPSEFHQHVVACLKAYGARLKTIHIVTTSKLADAFLIFIKPFFGAKLSNRFQVHKKIEGVFESVPKEIFPADYGGKEKTIAELHDDWLSVLNSKEYRDYMIEVCQARTEESKRLCVDKLNDEYLGMPGTFRSLKID